MLDQASLCFCVFVAVALVLSSTVDVLEPNNSMSTGVTLTVDILTNKIAECRVESLYVRVCMLFAMRFLLWPVSKGDV